MPLPADRALCICQICECGRHRCPHISAPKPTYDKECLISEYKTVFTGKSGDRTLAIKPQVVIDTDPRPFAQDTTNNLAYIAHPVFPPAPRKKQVWVPCTVPLDGTTTSRHHFVRHSVVPVKSSRPDASMPRKSGKMSDVTSHRADYTRKQADKVVPATDYSSLTCVPGPFDSSTTMRADYTKYSIRPRTSYTPHREYIHPTIPMDVLTNHKADFTVWSLPKRTVRTSAHFIPTVGRTGTTTFQNDFTVKKYSRPAPCLPQHADHQSGEFYDSTTFRDTFRAWPTHPPVQRERAVYNPPDAPLDSTTSYREQYTAKSARPATCKPRVDYRVPSGVMAKRTTHGDTYLQWKVKPATPALDHHVRSTPPPFSGISTYKEHYDECMGAPATLIAPINTYIRPVVSLDTYTTYARDYTAKESNKCPAPGLPQIPHLIRAGHKFYTSLDTNPTKVVGHPITA